MMTMENSDNTISDEAAPDTKSGFFAVDRQVWEVACDLGLREAVAYLVLARGSGGDNRTTSWSVHAIEEHTGIGRTRAKKALQNLIQKGLVRQDKGGTKPRYYLLPAHEVPGCKDYELAGTLNMSREEREALQPGWIWLPNTLVDGVGDVFAPIKQIRRTQKLAVLRLFIRLYDAHAFTDDGGINWRSGGIRQRYKRVRVGERSERIIWGFQPQKVECDPNAPFAALGAVFWSAWETLTATGLVEMVPHLIEADSDDAEIMHPVPFDWRGEALEHRVADGAKQVAEALVGAAALDEARGKGIKIFVPALRHLSEVQVVGIARLLHHPHTKMTQAWYAKMAANCEFYTSGYLDLLAKVQHQGLDQGRNQGNDQGSYQNQINVT